MAYPLFHELSPEPRPTQMTAAGFRAAFPGESDWVEFKQGLPEDEVRQAVTAFSNTDGGVILLGVRDDAGVQGISVDGEFRARVHRVITAVRDPGRYEVLSLSVEGRDVLVLSVHRRREGFAQMQDGRVLERRGAMNATLFGDELVRFLTRRALTRFEATPLQVSLEAASPRQLDRLRTAYGWSGDLPVRLAEAGLVDRGVGGAALTVAGALLLLDRPREVLGKAYIEVFRYRAGSDLYDRRFEIDGPVDRQVEEATAALMGELGSDVVVLGVRRHELPRLPETVLREALANAVSHRTYENPRQPVRVEIRPEQVVIRSPGSLPEPVTLENLREQNSARNVDLIRVLRTLGLAEDAGLGVGVMQDQMEAALLEEPRFEADEAQVTVVLRLGSTVTPRERAWIAEIETRGDIRATDRVLLLHAARGEILTNSTARDLLGVDSVHARAALQRLRDLGYLAQSGLRGGSSYTLAKELGPPAGLALSEDELRAVVLSMAAEGRVTNEAVRARTGLDRARVLALLKSCVERGELVMSGERRGAHYRLPR